MFLWSQHIRIAAPLKGRVLNGPAKGLPCDIRYRQNRASAKSISSLVLNVARQKGFLAREGIRLEIVPAESSTYEPIEILKAGKSDITRTNLTHQILGKQGLPAVKSECYFRE